MPRKSSGKKAAAKKSKPSRAKPLQPDTNYVTAASGVVTPSFVVNGAAYYITAKKAALLRDAVGQALRAHFGATDIQPSSESWEVRDHAGVLLDLSKTLDELSIVNGTTIYVNLPAGVQG